MAGSQDSRARASFTVISFPWFLLWEEESESTGRFLGMVLPGYFSREAELVVTSVGRGGGKERNQKSSEKEG